MCTAWSIQTLDNNFLDVSGTELKKNGYDSY